jgi:hypothetical protein
MSKPPAGFRLTGDGVLAIAKRNPTVVAELRKHPHLVPYVYTRGSVWQVSWFTSSDQVTARHPQIEMLQLYVDDDSGEVTQVWTGYQVAWTMARGYPGAFGRSVNALYVWIPLCVAFLLPFVPWRRRPTLWPLDLLVLLAFSISLAFFNHAEIGISVPLVYPCLIYLFGRMLALAFGRGRPRTPLRLTIPLRWLVVLLIFLVGFRIGLNVTNSNVIDVGYAGVIGADKIVHDEPLYGNWPSDNPQGDTYGPVNYFAYVPFRAVFGWSGGWDSLPAAHAASISFDLLTLIGLFLLGWMVRGPTGAVVLAYLWAAFPFTAFVLSSNSNDALVSLMVVACLLVLRWASVRGALGGLAALTKFAPFVLAPLLLRGVDEPPWRRGGARRWIPAVAAFTGAYVLAVLVPMLRVLLPGNFHSFWTDSIAYQAGRPAPFSIWGLWGGYGHSLHPEQHVWLGIVVALGFAVLIVPRGRRTLVQVAALAAALLIGLQLGLSYWFYLYIVWFFPLLIVALVFAHPDADELAARPVDEWSEPSRPAFGQPSVA